MTTCRQPESKFLACYAHQSSKLALVDVASIQGVVALGVDASPLGSKVRRLRCGRVDVAVDEALTTPGRLRSTLSRKKEMSQVSATIEFY
jgi:hypothetical protein